MGQLGLVGGVSYLTFCLSSMLLLISCSLMPGFRFLLSKLSIISAASQNVFLWFETELTDEEDIFNHGLRVGYVWFYFFCFVFTEKRSDDLEENQMKGKNSSVFRSRKDLIKFYCVFEDLLLKVKVDKEVLIGVLS